MPLFKGQGCKSTPKKAIDYITNDEKAEYVSSQYLDDNRSYAEQFRETAELWGKGDKFDERKYYHFKLSCDRSDEVSAKAHHEYAEALAKKLFPDFECVIATHTDTDTVHSHIIVNAVSFDNGHKLHCSPDEYGRMKDTTNILGAELGFSSLDFRKRSRHRDNITRAEKEITVRGGETWKEELREVIAEAKYTAKNMTEFEEHLKKYGVTLARNTEKTISYLHPNKEKAIRGDKLGADYTKGAILNELEANRRNVSNTERTATGVGGRKQDEIRKHPAEGRIGRIEREVRSVGEGVFERTSEGRETMERRAEAEQRAAREAVERAEQERERIEEVKSAVVKHIHGRGL